MYKYSIATPSNDFETISDLGAVTGGDGMGFGFEVRGDER